MPDDAAPGTGIPPAIEKLLRRFGRLTPDLARQALVQYADRLPPLPERFRELDPEQYRVHECQSPVAIFPEVIDGRMHYHADVPRSAPTIRALLAMIFEALNDQPPEAVLAIPPDFVRRVMGGIGLETREVGLNAMVERLKRAARAASEGADPAGGGRG